jgi:hypothetical protein
MDMDKDVQGVGIYAEFARNDATTQIIVCPDGYDNTGRLIGLSVVRRVITAKNPKKPWRFTILEAESGGGTIMDTEKDSYCAKRMAVPATLFDQILAGDWKMVGEPILLEVSKKDLDDIGVKKTPTKLLYRAMQSRSALGFPENLINSTIV